MNIIINYNGPDNLDETLDNNITYLIGKYFYENKIEFKITNLEFISAKPNLNDELVRYKIELGMNKSDFKYSWILNELKNEGFEKGLTIKLNEKEIIYADLYTPNIQYRRSN